MAEIAGLVIGGVSLVTLFDTCLSGYDKIELARNYGRDYERLVVKFELLRTRFYLWGQAMGLEQAPNSAQGLAEITESQIALCTNWNSVKETVGNSLVAIQGLLQDLSKLEKSYGLVRISDSKVASAEASESQMVMRDRQKSSALSEVFESLSVRSRSWQKESSPRKKFLWAIRDREEFQELINELLVFVENLEAVSNLIGALRLQKSLVQRRVQSVTSLEGVSLLNAATAEEIEPRREQPGSMTEFIRAVVSNRALQINGDVGFSSLQSQAGRGKHVKPAARDDAKQINGAVSADAFRALLGR